MPQFSSNLVLYSHLPAPLQFNGLSSHCSKAVETPHSDRAVSIELDNSERKRRQTDLTSGEFFEVWFSRQCLRPVFSVGGHQIQRRGIKMTT